jgi:diadenosine tetraphosphate (Ap4A) HIT family hydrolase
VTRAGDCVFCGIAGGELEASIVLEDDVALVFMDLNPITPGHTLVVPWAHAASLAELPSKAGGHLFGVAMRVAAAVRASGLRADGVNLFLADGEAAGQEVFHVHLHVIPRFAGDGLEIRHAASSPGRGALDEAARAIRAGLAAQKETM